MSGNHADNRKAPRTARRVHTVEDISVHYEGRTEEVAARLPDVSPGGMFINTPYRFPEGAVLNLRFRLSITGAEINTRCEVRYCMPGVGVGVEFVGISPEATEAIEHEIALCETPSKHPVAKTKKKLPTR